MKLVKPQMLGFVQQTLEARGKCLCTFGVPLLFEIGGEAKLLPEVELWRLLGAELAPDLQFDTGVAKSRSEYVVVGEAFAPEAKPVGSCHVRVKLGALEKMLFVTGDRQWVHGAPSAPVPFQTMPIVWQRAYGGPGLADNPVGKGHRPIDAGGGRIVHELPNIEDPRRPMRTLSDQALPATFLPLDMLWPERAKKRGTYDKTWMETRFPGLPDDFDWSFFNVAAEDQQAPQPFAGDELLRLENLHPTLPVVSGRLPGVRARGWVRRHRAEAELEELAMRLDTVWLFPKLERGIVVFHGAIEVAEDDSRDIHQAVFALEALGSPKPLEHYQQSLLRREDPEEGPLATLDDRDLMPEGFTLPDIEPKERPGELRDQRMRRAFEEKIQETRDLVASYGLDPDIHASKIPPPPPPPATLETLPARLKQAKEEAARSELEAQQLRQTLTEHAKKEVESMGLDWKFFEEEFSQTGPGGPPKFRAQAELDRLQKLADECRAIGFDPEELDGYLADPKVREQIANVESTSREGYRVTAHFRNPPRPLSPEEREVLRAKVVAAHASGESMEGADLTGADLSGLSLPKAMLAHAFMEAVDLTDTDLSGSDLTGAVLARANLTRTLLAGAKLVGTSFGAATLRNTNLAAPAGSPGIDASGAVLARAELDSADLQGIKLENADLTECKIRNSNFSDAELPEATFMKADLSGTNFARAKFHKSNFLETRLDGTDFSDADLTLASFVDCKGTGTSFRGANLTKAAFVMNCELEAADFRGAKLAGCTLRELLLTRANFSGALAGGADFSEAKLEDAVFFRADAVEARFIRAELGRANFMQANLMSASFQKARAHGTNFARSNLFRADFGRARFDRATSFEGALLNQVKLLPRAT